MKVLVLGSGGREHALVDSLARSPTVHKIFACPGNSGMKEQATLIPATSNIDIVRFAKENVDLAVVGPSRFVSEGTVDALNTAGIPVIGPAADAGRIETSKAFSAKFMAKHNIPSPVTQVVANRFEAEKFLEENPWVGIVKCDGFSRGSGVAVVHSSEDALGAVIRLLKEYGPPIILQEKLSGIEFSYSILTDGNQWVSFSSCRDYNLALDNDKGPTTGGMGAVSPFPGLFPELEEKIRTRIVIPTVNGLKSDRLLYRGFLSIQLMLTPQGPRVLEFNARLGDPEAQSILVRFRGDLAALLLDCALGRLDATGSEVAFGKHSGVAVVLARKGYPTDESATSSVDNVEAVKNSRVFFSDCRWQSAEEKWVFKSGRLVSVCSVGETLQEARRVAYEDISKLRLADVMFRSDIGAS